MWEHAVAHATISYQAAASDKDIQKVLDEYSFAGWELVSVVESAHSGTTNRYRLFFKREIKEPCLNYRDWSPLD